MSNISPQFSCSKAPQFGYLTPEQRAKLAKAKLNPFFRVCDAYMADNISLKSVSKLPNMNVQFETDLIEMLRAVAKSWKGIILSFGSGGTQARLQLLELEQRLHEADMLISETVVDEMIDSYKSLRG